LPGGQIVDRALAIAFQRDMHHPVKEGTAMIPVTIKRSRMQTRFGEPRRLRQTRMA